MNDNSIKKPSSSGKGCLLVLLLFLLIIVSVFIIIKLTLTPANKPNKEISTVNFEPKANQLLLEEELLNQILLDMVPPQNLFSISQLQIDCSRNSVSIYSEYSLQLSLMDFPIKKDINGSIEALLEVKPEKDVYIISLKKLKIGRMPVPLFMVRTKLYSRINDTIPISSNSNTNEFQVDLLSKMEEELSLQGLEQLTFREEGILLILSPKALGLGNLDTNFTDRVIEQISQDLENKRDIRENPIGKVLVQEMNMFKEADNEDRAFLTYIEGDVLLINKDTEWLANFGDEILPGQTIAVQRNGYCEILLPDGSMVKLMDQAVMKVHQLYYNQGERSIHLDMDSGVLAAKVSKVINQDSKFDINIGSTVMGIRGTSFQINMKKQSFTLLLQEGHVEISNDYGNKNLNGGEKLEGSAKTLEEVAVLSEDELQDLNNHLLMVTKPEVLSSYKETNVIPVFNSALRIYREYEGSDKTERDQFTQWLEDFIQSHPEFQKEMEKIANEQGF